MDYIFFLPENSEFWRVYKKKFVRNSKFWRVSKVFFVSIPNSGGFRKFFPQKFGIPEASKPFSP
jgi:hypothetical protein